MNGWLCGLDLILTGNYEKELRPAVGGKQKEKIKGGKGERALTSRRMRVLLVGIIF